MFDPFFTIAFFLPIIAIGGAFLLLWALYYKRAERRKGQSYAWITKPMSITGLCLMGGSTALGFLLLPYFNCDDEYCVQGAYFDMMER